MIMNNSSHIEPSECVSCLYAVSIVFTTVFAIISVAAIIGNILVIASMYKTPNLRTSTNYYYVNMAVSDLLSSVIIWPLFLVENITTRSEDLLQGSLPAVGCKVGMYSRTLSSIVSSLSLLLIAVDRFIAVVFPLKAKLITRKVRGSLLFASWLIPMIHLTPLIQYSEYHHFSQETLKCKYKLNGWETKTLVMYNFTPLVAIVIIYSRIMRALRGTKPELTGHSWQKRNEQNQNLMKVFKSIVAAYVLCIYSLGVYGILKVTAPDFDIADKYKLIRNFSYFVLPPLRTAINPVILFAFSTNFRLALKKLSLFSPGKCCTCCYVSRQQEMPNVSSPELVKYIKTLSE